MTLCGCRILFPAHGLLSHTCTCWVSPDLGCFRVPSEFANSTSAGSFEDVRGILKYHCSLSSVTAVSRLVQAPQQAPQSNGGCFVDDKEKEEEEEESWRRILKKKRTKITKMTKMMMYVVDMFLCCTSNPSPAKSLVEVRACWTRLEMLLQRTVAVPCKWSTGYQRGDEALAMWI